MAKDSEPTRISDPQTPLREGRAKWERPALRRLAASEAEMGGNAMSDNGSNTS
jgi:hypothetical protein